MSPVCCDIKVYSLKRVGHCPRFAIWCQNFEPDSSAACDSQDGVNQLPDLDLSQSLDPITLSVRQADMAIVREIIVRINPYGGLR